MEIRIPEDTPFDTHLLGKASLDTEYPLFYTPISWSAIFAGLVTALATSICLSFLVAALGLSQIDFYSSSPFEGSFLSVGIGSFIVMLISLASGAFVAGRLAAASGALHGFLTWALLTLIMTFQSIIFVSSAAKLGAKAAVENSSAIQQTADSVKKNLSSLFSKLTRENFEDFLGDKKDNGINFDKLHNELQTVLDKNDIPALNPDHLKQYYQAALKDIDSTITAFKNDPSHYHDYLEDLADHLSDHVQAIKVNIDQSDIINDLMKNGMTRAEAQKAANRAVHLYQTAEAKTKQAIKSFEQQAHTLSKKLDRSLNDMRHEVSKAKKTGSHIGWFGFFVSFICAIISSIFGYYGY
uniref:TIGR04086 family membrane protein n=1 Tax=Bartonella sp. CB169 TaxID=3112257 RepID=UPI00300E05F8